MPILPNPTPPDPIPPDSEDELPDAFDPLDLNKDGVVDDDELEFASFINDGTGLHPSPTTYATTTVMQSSVYGDETATPTPSTYHLTYTISQLFEYNKAAGDNLDLNRTAPEWGGYGPHPDYSRIKKTGTDNYQPFIWEDGFKPGYSWDWQSPITGNVYDAICPFHIYMSRGGVFSSSKPLYYFFVEIYNDYQALHGYANYSYGQDGYPSPHWPGMIKVVYSNSGDAERPRDRSLYEKWFKDRYGKVGAPYMHYEEKLTNKTVPTRFRTIHDFDDTRPTRDEDPGETEVVEERLEAPPPMQSLTTPITVGKPGAGVATEAWNPVSRGTPWLKVVSNVVPAGYTGEYTSQLAAQGEANSHIVINMPSDTAKGWCAQPGITGQSDYWYYDERFSVFSAYVTAGSTSQCVGLITTTKAGSTKNGVYTAGALTGGTLIVSPYGLTSTAARAYVDGQDTQLLEKPGGMEGILAIAPSNPVAFMYDASIGNWGKVIWLSHF